MFPISFRNKMLELAQSSSKDMKTLADEHGIHTTTLQHWVWDYLTPDVAAAVASKGIRSRREAGAKKIPICGKGLTPQRAKVLKGLMDSGMHIAVYSRRKDVSMHFATLRGWVERYLPSVDQDILRLRSPTGGRRGNPNGGIISPKSLHARILAERKRLGEVSRTADKVSSVAHDLLVELLR